MDYYDPSLGAQISLSKSGALEPFLTSKPPKTALTSGAVMLCVILEAPKTQNLLILN